VPRMLDELQSCILEPQSVVEGVPRSCKQTEPAPGVYHLNRGC
jgi:hypothetical protein